MILLGPKNIIELNESVEGIDKKKDKIKCDDKYRMFKHHYKTLKDLITMTKDQASRSSS